MRSMSAFLGIGLQLSAEKKENRRLGLAAQAQAEHDPLACRVLVSAGEHAGQKGLLQTWAGTDGLVAVLLTDGSLVKVAASEVQKLDAGTKGFDELDAEHKQVAVDNGFVAAVRTPTTDEEAKGIIAKFIRTADMGRRALGEQMLANRAALALASAPDADFSHLAVYAAAKVCTLGPNQTELTVGNKTLFYSGQTVVGSVEAGAVTKTKNPGSPTAARHLEAWLAGRETTPVEQDYLDKLGRMVESAVKNPVVAEREMPHERHNRRQNAIMDKARKLEKERLARGEKPNPNLTDVDELPSSSSESIKTAAGRKVEGAVATRVEAGLKADQEPGYDKDRRSLERLEEIKRETGETPAKADFKLEDIGLENPQNFTGRGVSGTEWGAVFTGVGNSYVEAANDAMEMAAQAGYDVEGLAVPGLDDPRASQDMVGEDSDLLYHVALYLKGEPGVEASKHILVRAAEPKTKVKKSLSDRLDEEQAAGDAAKSSSSKMTPPPNLKERAQGKTAPASSSSASAPASKSEKGEAKPAEKKGSAVDFFKDLLKEAAAAETPAAEEEPAGEGYPGVQKVDKRSTGPQAEEAWKIRQKSPDKVKESGPGNALNVSQGRHGSLDPEKLAKVMQAPLEVAQAVEVGLRAEKAMAEMAAAEKKAVAEIREKGGYDAKRSLATRVWENLGKFLKEETGGQETVKLITTFLSNIRAGMKAKLQYTPEELKAITKAKEDMQAALDAIDKKVLDEGRVTWEEASALWLSPELEPRKGEHGAEKSGPTVPEMALGDIERMKKEGIKSNLQAGMLEKVKEAISSLSGLFKKAFGSLTSANDMLEKKLGEGGEASSSSAAGSASEASSSSKSIKAARQAREAQRLAASKA